MKIMGKEIINEKQLSFDELKTVIDDFAGKPINANIINNTRRYYFYSLKPSVSHNPDLCGVSLNHSFQPQKYARSKFHDNEDIGVIFWRDEFKSAKFQEWNHLIFVDIQTKTFYCELKVNKH